MSELQANVEYLKSSAVRNRRLLFWIGSAILLLLLLMRVKELTALVLLSYGIAVLLDPIVAKLEKRNVSRALSIIGIYVLLFAVILALIVVAVPAIVREYRELIQVLPQYLKTAGERTGGLLQSWLGIAVPMDSEALANEAKNYVSALSVEQLKTFARAVGKTLLQGYSFVLTIINLVLLPFLVFYLTRDLRMLHQFLGGFLSKEAREGVSSIGGEILTHVYAFFKGQLTVSVILAILYVIGLSLVGLPWAIIVGAIAGLLNIVPYLGVGLGFLLATMITLVADATITQLLLVWGVFVVVQILEGNFLTPKIVGESVGIHPLGVMLALIVGGQLFGLIGLILAIPAAAAIRVLFRTLREAIEEGEETEEVSAAPS